MSTPSKPAPSADPERPCPERPALERPALERPALERAALERAADPERAADSGRRDHPGRSVEQSGPDGTEPDSRDGAGHGTDTDSAPEVSGEPEASDVPRPAAEGTGVLVLAGTPIGAVADASPRLGAELAAADVIAAEDTRRLRRLADRLGVVLRARVVSYFEGNEARRTPQLVQNLRDGDRVLVVTDAGMPAVSDPGYRLVTAAIDAGIPVTAVPGPSAVLTALALSGLPVDRFCFEGFPPRKPGERARRLRELAAEPRTMVFFEAPHRLADSLQAMADAFGEERPAAVCRELTKVYEEVRRDALGALAEWARDGVRGEVTVVVAGRPATSAAEVDETELARLVAERVAEGTSRKTAIADVAAELGLPRRTVYNAAVARPRS